MTVNGPNLVPSAGVDPGGALMPRTPSISRPTTACREQDEPERDGQQEDQRRLDDQRGQLLERPTDHQRGPQTGVARIRSNARS
jgi:hypothetical protein